jgi:putative membrane protein
MNSRLIMTFAGTVAFAASSCAFAAQNKPEQDKDFVLTASEGGVAEVALGKLAAEKAQNPDVKSFAIKMVHDHSALNDKMKPVAMQLGVTPTENMNAAHDAKYAELKVLTGDAFDKAYIEAMAKAHHEDLKAFQQEASSAGDPHLKSVVAEGEKVIAMHTEMVDKLAQKLGVQVASN